MENNPNILETKEISQFFKNQGINKHAKLIFMWLAVNLSIWFYGNCHVMYVYFDLYSNF